MVIRYIHILALLRMRSYHTVVHHQLRMLTSIAAQVRFAVYKPIKPVVCCFCTTRSIVAILPLIWLPRAR